MLHKPDIIRLIQDKAILVHPWDASRLGTNSYDVSLGEFFYREQPPDTRAPIYNIYDQEAVGRVWGRAPLVAEPLASLSKLGLLPSRMTNIAPNDRVILLAPGETILAHTEEFIGGVNGSLTAVTTKMHSRSTIGRSLLGVCKCAGLGDVGYITRWTMEITSFSRYYYIPLVVGRRIAQIEFSEGHLVSETYSQRTGKYQQGETLQEVVKNWRPELMLPRLYMDRELQGNV